MKIIYKVGDLFDETNQEMIIVHSCNILGGFGSGVAGVIKKRYPESRQDYIDAFEGDELKLGKVIWSKTGNNRFLIGHMICQPTVLDRANPNDFDGYKIRHVSYDAVDLAMRNLDFYAKEISDGNGLPVIAMPLIGSDLGGGSWKVIEAIIENRSHNFQPVVYMLTDKIPE